MRRSRNISILLLMLLLIPGFSAAITTYDISLQGSSADVNITIELYPENPDRTTHLTFDTSFLPDGMQVESVKDSDGRLDYTVEGDNIRFETEVKASEGKEVVVIQGSIPRVNMEEHMELDLVTFQLSGFPDRNPDVPDEVTQVRLETERNLLAESHSFGFDMSLGRNGANYSGEGPVNLHLSVSDEGERYENLVLFGPGDLSTSDDLYWVPAAVTGFLPQVNRFPVVVYPDSEYDTKVDEWSAGQYRPGGVIFVRKSTLEDEQGPAVVLHEVMHGFNDQALNWYSGERAWFDEGTAKYVEWLVNEKREVPQAEIFGDRVTWNCGPRKRCSYEPRGTPDQLWDFYQRDTRFLASWTPLQSDPETRRFGYALSELVFRDYVVRNGPASLQGVYTEIVGLNDELEERIGGVEATSRLKDIMGTEFRPCDSPSRDKFEQCLESVNGMEGRVPELPETTRQVEKVEIQPIEQPPESNQSIYDRIQERTSEEAPTSSDFRRFFRGFVQWVLGLLGLA